MKTFYTAERAQWRAWLQQNAASATEIWLVSYKKEAGKPSLAYSDAVEEALCFGWVDSLVKKLDERRYAHKFTPRKPRSAWSRSNVERVERLIAQGRMTPAGLAAFADHESRALAPPPTVLPRELEAEFKSRKKAWTNFGAFPPGYRRMVIAWVAGAKRDETQRRRLETLIEASERDERLSFM